ncbi:MAG: hypothetical protein ACI8XB_002013 [Patiriisocius sp.]
MNSTKALAPFSCQYSLQVPELLMKLNCSIALSTYQAGKLVLISAKDANSLVQLPRHFERVMGIAENQEKDKLALACKDQVIVFANSPDLAKYYPKAPGKYDALYMPRMTYHTGSMDIHDLSFGQAETLFAVNTLFSCIVKLDSDFNFTPYWKPPFIDKLVSEDRCHLNGMAMKNGKPKYVTAFNTGNTFKSWRENITKTGVVIDVENNSIVAKDLDMPHSPRIFNDELYVLLSATGELVKINVEDGSKEVIVKIGGFVRGMSLHQDYLFIGTSKLRENSSTFSQLEIEEKSNLASIKIVHLPTKNLTGEIKYLSSLDEIYDIHVLSGKRRPNIMNTLTEDHKAGLMIPDTTFWAKKTDPNTKNIAKPTK